MRTLAEANERALEKKKKKKENMDEKKQKKKVSNPSMSFRLAVNLMLDLTLQL